MSNIHPHATLPRQDKETLLGQRGIVLWFCGLSGSGKSTIAGGVERVLHDQGRYTVRLDGDNLRTGLNANLSFSDDDRLENIRRTSEVAKILSTNGAIVLCSLITPRGIHRDLARGILGDDFAEIYVKASYQACEARDVKGLYAKAAKGEVANFTGRDSGFEEPQQAELVLDTEKLTVEDAVCEVLEFLSTRGVPAADLAGQA
ncbi:adenylyl-sulfate kinase [Luteolibacter flavescens]|uniref:Adenylyl-sulfate kinase n=1 Tax=Luteolibacter flavescens TaxID=1859460 RepID=A0ABT3FPP6_9BACT|nr:adenylyl-sulfate kinase [Luteolibacter flavescens]MCW1885184.1 adenylyl-sulfate kinase [Luteolibacter flavescens]